MITTSMEHYRVQPGSRVDLAKWDADDKSVFDGSKKDGKEVLPELTARLDKLQELLWAGQKHKVLLVLQAMDTAGKDGAIRHVFTGINPQGIRVANFKAPSAEELAHDYLWRIHKQTPASGEIVIFNRSHYEDVLVVRVHELAPVERWRRRFDQINAFELALAEEVDLRADTWHVLVDDVASPGILPEWIRVFLARDLHDVPLAQRHTRDGEEHDLHPLWVPFADAVRDGPQKRRRTSSAVAMPTLEKPSQAARYSTRLIITRAMTSPRLRPRPLAQWL